VSTNTIDPHTAARTQHAPQTPVHRFEVRAAPGRSDTRAAALSAQAHVVGVAGAQVNSARVYLVEAALTPDDITRISQRLLADPVTEVCSTGAAPAAAGAHVVEVHPLPGVMDSAAQTVQDAIVELLAPSRVGVAVSTGWRFDVSGVAGAAAESLVRGLVANPVIHKIHVGSWTPAALPHGHEAAFKVRSVPILTLNDEQLTKMSREAHLFLSLDEMRAVQAEFRRIGRDPTDIELETIAQTWSEHCVHKTLKSTVRYREERGGGLETLIAPKPTSKPGQSPPGAPPRTGFDFAFTPRGTAANLGTSRRPEAVDEDDAEAQSNESSAGTPIDFEGRPGHRVHDDGSVTITNLLKSTVAAATHELIAGGVDWALSVFKDNSGVIAFDDTFGVCVKVETHNRPSAIEPYGGSATGIGGCIRDVIGTGLGAKPIANTNVFCVAFPEKWATPGSASSHAKHALPPGTLHPRRILTDVVAGVRDYGNRMGIPTVSGGVFFDDRHVGNPLVFAGCVGLIPRDRIFGKVHAGDVIVALGGRTGRDGIHGATFSSAELEHTAADEFAHAVQIGNAIEEKRTLDAILRARDFSRTPGGPKSPLFNAITDCGAGGFSSAVGEMGSTLGATVDLDRAPLKYAGLTYTEIWISEAQERMVLAVPPENLDELRRICAEEHVELAELGTFGTPNAELVLRYRGTEVGRLSMHFMHDGIPTPTREAVWSPGGGTGRRGVPDAGRTSGAPRVDNALLTLLAHPTIASKHWIIRQYDHEVQGNTILRPLVGPAGRGPGDASVIEPVPNAGRGIAISCGLQTGVGDPLLPAGGGDPYQMALAGIDECVRNLVCVGANPSRIAILDNFCWPSCEKPENLGMLVRACEGCYDGAKAYGTPFVSGKDSLNNQLRITDEATGTVRVIEIPPTLLITGVAIVPSVNRTTTMDAKRAGNVLVLIGATTGQLGGSLVQRLLDEGGAASAAVIPPLGAGAWDELDHSVPEVDLSVGPRTARAVYELVSQQIAASAHDCSEGGVLVAVAEMLIAAMPNEHALPPAPATAANAGAGDSSAANPLAALLSGVVKPQASTSAPKVSNPIADLVKNLIGQGAGTGAGATAAASSGSSIAPPGSLGVDMTFAPGTLSPIESAFAETPSRYVIEISPADVPRMKTILRDHGGIPFATIGTLTNTGRLSWPAGDVDVSVAALMNAWRGPLDW
jgi:phosphoribosylformylglycinamidine synthase subunit PurSL